MLETSRRHKMSIQDMDDYMLTRGRDKEKRYAHYISCASFSGTRINLRYAVVHGIVEVVVSHSSADKSAQRVSQYMTSFSLCIRLAKVCNLHINDRITGWYNLYCSDTLISLRRLAEAAVRCRNIKRKT